MLCRCFKKESSGTRPTRKQSILHQRARNMNTPKSAINSISRNLTRRRRSSSGTDHDTIPGTHILIKRASLSKNECLFVSYLSKVHSLFLLRSARAQGNSDPLIFIFHSPHLPPWNQRKISFSQHPSIDLVQRIWGKPVVASLSF